METAATTETEVRGVQANPRPELTFRGLLPKEALIETAREQDALLRGVLSLHVGVAQVLIERSDAAETRHRVRVKAEVEGQAKRGCAEHREPDWALRMAFTALLRDIAGAKLANDCAPWAA